MSRPMAPGEFVERVRARGVQVYEVGMWRTHNRNSKGSWLNLYGVMIHHTVTKGTVRTVEICQDGYDELPGPLCHGVIAKSGALYMVGWGRANHAGKGDDDVLQAVIEERATLPAPNELNTDGNAHFYGFECENLGDGKDPWPRDQLDTIAVVSMVICDFHGWTERSVIGHLEWQKGKVDPRGPGITMEGVRRDVGALLRSGKLPHAPAPEPKPLTVEQRLSRLEKKVFG